MTNTSLLILALGWQGGTIHQAAKETGLTTDQILNDLTHVTLTRLGEDNGGWSAVSTCSLEWNRTVNFPKRKGDIKYWKGAANYVKIALDHEWAIYGTVYTKEEQVRRGWIQE